MQKILSLFVNVLVMRHTTFVSLLFLLCLAVLCVTVRQAHTTSSSQDPKAPQSDQKPERGIGVQAASPTPTPGSGTSVPPQASAPVKPFTKPEIVLQAGITFPQTQISFSRDGRLLASMGLMGNSIKLWEVATGRLLRQLESSIPSIGSSSKTQPFGFSVDGKSILAFGEGRLRRWEVDTGKELNNVLLANAKASYLALLSDDSRTLATSNMDNSAVRLWDTTTGRELRTVTFEDQERLDAQDAIALSPDGRLLAVVTVSYGASMKSIEHKRRVSVWDVSTGKRVQHLEIDSTRIVGLGADAFPVAVVAFSPDGSWLAVRSKMSMKIWEVATGKEIKTLATPRGITTQDDPAFGSFTNKFAFSFDRRTLSLGGEANGVRLVETASTNTLRTLRGHEGNIVAVAFSGDDKLLASSGVDNEIKLWDVASGTEIRTFKGSAMPVNDIAFARDGKSLALAGQEGISFWELTTGGVRRALSPESDYVRSMKNLTNRGGILSPDGRFLMAGSSGEPTVKLWEVTTGRELRNVQLTAGKVLGNAAFSATGSTIAVLEVDKPKPPPDPSASSPPNPTGMPDGVSMPDTSKIMEMARKDPKKMQAAMKQAQEAMAKGDFSAGMQVMESLGLMPTKANANPNRLRILEATSGRQLSAAPLPGGFMNEITSGSAMATSSLAFSPDGRVLASVLGFNSPIQITDVSTGQPLQSLKTPYSLGVNSLAWSPDGKLLASSAWGTKKGFNNADSANDFSFEDMTFSIKLWNPQTAAEVMTLPGHNNMVMHLAFSPDGRLLASGGYDNIIKIWEVSSGRELHRLSGHTAWISALDFSPDGKFLVSGSDDASSRLWNVGSGELLATLVTLNKGNDWLVVTPDGLFDGSPGGWNQILWRFSPTTFDVSPVEIFFNEYFHPGLLPDILAGKKLAVAADILQKDRRQPRLGIEAAGVTPANVSTRAVKLKINVSDAPAGAKDLRLFRNGSLVKVWRGDVLSGQPVASVEATVNIAAGENRFTVYAFNRDNVKSTDATILLNGADSLKRPSALHLVAVGVNQYANTGYNLKYAVADGEAFAAEVERQQRKLGQYADIKVTKLFDQQATKANLMYALTRLAGVSDAKLPDGAPSELDKISPAQPEDGVVVYFAGHGTARDQRFYLIPHDLGYQGKRNELDAASLNDILTHSISDLELEQAFEGMDAGVLLMVIDACNSGQALEAEEKRRGPMNSKGLAQLAYEKGMYILTAAQSYQAALEAEQLGHGYLTFALVEEGLKSVKADAEPADGQIMLREWLNYATDRVPQMQEQKMKAARGVGLELAFVTGEERVADVDKRSVQRPRVFYRRELESQPMVVAKP